MNKSTSKQPSSKIIGLQKMTAVQLENLIGSQRGETGSEMAIQSNLPEPTADQAQAAKIAMKHLRLSQPKDMAEYRETVAKVAWLKKSASRTWILARVATLLDHYYQAKGNPDVMRAVSKDWADMLAEYPSWAISNACRGWLVSEKCQYKPVPGQLIKLIKKEMTFVGNIEVGLRQVETIIREQRASQRGKV